MSNWNVTVSEVGGEPRPFAIVAIEDDRDVYRYMLSLMLDLQERYDNPAIFVNGKKFVPKEDHLADYSQYLCDIVAGKKPEKPPIPELCMRRYAENVQEHANDLREQAERIVGQAQRPVVRTKVKVR